MAQHGHGGGTYSLGALGTPLRVGVLSVLALPGIGMVVLLAIYVASLSSLRQVGPDGDAAALLAIPSTLCGFLCPAVWWAIWGWNAYWFLGRIAVEVSLDGQTLHWRTPLRHGDAPLARLVRIRPVRWSRCSMLAIEIAGAPSVLLQVRKGLVPWLTELHAAHPTLEIQPGRWSRMVEELPDWMAWPQ